MKISYCPFLKSDEVPSARPGPNMIFLNMVKLDVFPATVRIINIGVIIVSIIVTFIVSIIVSIIVIFRRW